MTEKTCPTCLYGYINRISDRICVNDKSEYCTECMSAYDSCEFWDEREEEG